MLRLCRAQIERIGTRSILWIWTHTSSTDEMVVEILRDHNINNISEQDIRLPVVVLMLDSVVRSRLL
jgi:hypothetical protein